MINKYFYDDGIVSYRFKSVASTFETFKEQVEKYNYFLKDIDDDKLMVVYYSLMLNFGNSWCRARLPELFYQDLGQTLLRTFMKYNKLLDTIEYVYTQDLLLDERETFSETKTNESTSDSYLKNADTPTTISSDEDFVDKYTNSASKQATNVGFNENISNERTKTFNIVKSLKNSLELSDLVFDKLVQEYAQHFVQIDDPINYINYTGE